MPLPPEGDAVQVAEFPANILEGETKHVADTEGFATVTSVHTPQLFPSLLSLMVPTKEALLSAQALTYQLPAVVKV